MWKVIRKHWLPMQRRIRDSTNIIMEIAGGEIFSSVFKAYAIVIFTYHADLPGGFVRHPRETIQEHLEMIEAICNRDEDKARKTHASPHEAGERKIRKRTGKGGAKSKSIVLRFVFNGGNDQISRRTCRY